MNPLWISKTGLEAQQNKLSTISNNLANVNTTGFKRDRIIFEDLMYQNVRQAGGQTSRNSQLPSGLMIGTGVRTVATQKLHGQGNINQTDNKLDVAINGRGYFQVLRPNGEIAYTRDGTFQMDSEGKVVTSSGYQLEPQINLPPDANSITISQDGIVTARIPGNPQPQQVGQIALSDFVNPSGLEPVGENMFIETAASGAPQQSNPGEDGTGLLVQGALEGSNVNVVEELVNMIETQRAYEMNSKAISTVDQMMQFVNNQL
jgi:flagellar basal-body rod protein FlgG